MTGRTARDYLDDIKTELDNIEKFTHAMSFDLFKKDTRTQYACIRSLEIIGEAAKNIPDHYKKTHHVGLIHQEKNHA